MPTRRHFLQWAGVGAAASLAARGGAAKEPAAADPRAAKPRGRQTFQLGLASYTFRKFTLDQALAMTNRVGLKHICLKSFHLPLTATRDEIAQAAAKVKAAGLDLYGCGVIVMRNLAEVDQGFTYAKAAGMRVIIAQPSAEMLERINEQVQDYDIRLAIHNHGPGDKVFPTPDAAYEKIKNLDRRVGLCIDIGHTIRIGGDPIRAVEAFRDRVFDMHIKDVSAVTAADDVEVEVGRGIIDIPRLLGTLEKIQYAGMASFEYEKDPDDPLPGLAESVGYVRGVLAAISPAREKSS